MFDALTQQLDGIFKKLRSRGKLHPKQVDNAVTDMRTALLDADVSVEVADELLARVQGSGKTTASAKLARMLREKGKHPLLVAADLQRPAAVQQLFTLGEEIGVPVASDGTDPVKVAKAGVKRAEREGLDVVIVDT